MIYPHVALPRQGNIYQVLNIFAYLKNHHNAQMVFDPTEPDIKMSQFENKDWSQKIFGELNEAVPPNSPIASGRGMCMTVWVESDHNG